MNPARKVVFRTSVFLIFLWYDNVSTMHPLPNLASQRHPICFDTSEERRYEMEGKKESIEGKRKIADYARWIIVTVFGLLIIITVFMAVYRKFGG